MTPRIRVHEIVANAAGRHGVSVAEVMARDQHKAVVKARGEAIVQIKREFRFSLPHIGRLLKLHHTTVHYHLLRAGYCGEQAPRDPTQPDESGIWAI